MDGRALKKSGLQEHVQTEWTEARGTSVFTTIQHTQSEAPLLGSQSLTPTRAPCRDSASWLNHRCLVFSMETPRKSQRALSLYDGMPQKVGAPALFERNEPVVTNAGGGVTFSSSGENKGVWGSGPLVVTLDVFKYLLPVTLLRLLYICKSVRSASNPISCRRPRIKRGSGA
ncbi:unnamed protein product [Pleuronectes platessa]|uniref:Uncharacterized protein n=1 Tax=Pleuronectes platessa TaxID=8262 RepID=A0A9N7YJB3_PLEPL|nr:unnamed protein product [Pleuronectes platessa]